MSQIDHPHPVHVPTLTEVIELQVPAPVAEQGMTRDARPVPAPMGAPGAGPIVTGGLASSHAPSNWTPMTTVVLPVLSDVALPPVNLDDLPVLAAEVADPVSMDLAPDLAAPEAEAVAAKPEVAAPAIDEAQLAQRVLGTLQKQVDSMIDFRLKEALAPILARHADALVRELREELSQTMRDVVSKAISQEMAKLRQR
jgi:hypothetical protein